MISPSFPFPANDGAKIVIKNSFENLQQYCEKVDLLCLNKELLTLSEKEKIPNAEVYFVPSINSKVKLIKALLFNESYLVSKFFNRNFLEIIKKKIKNNNYDLIHFESLHTSKYAFAIKEEFDLPITIRFHNIESQIMQRYYDYTNNFFLQQFFKYEQQKMSVVEQRCINEIKNIIFISKEDQEYTKSKGHLISKTLVSPSGVDLDYFTNGTDYTNYNLIYLGSMDWKPNEDAVLWFYNKVFVKLLNKFPELVFYIVGKNPSNRIKNLKSKNVIVTGKVEDVRPFCKKAGIAVIPLQVGGGMRIKILEFMAMGLPIITTSLGAEGIKYKENENILIKDSEELFFDAVRYLIDNKMERERIGKNGRVLVEEIYSWQIVSRDLFNYFQKVLKNSEAID